MTGILIVTAVLFGLCYLALSWIRPELAIGMMLASAPFANLLLVRTGFQLALAEACLVLTLPMLLAKLILGRKDFQIGYFEFSIFVYLGLSLASSLNTLSSTSTIISLIQTAEYLLAAVLIFSKLVSDPTDLQWGLRGIVLSGVLLAASVLKADSYYVLGLHKNGIGDSLAAATLVAFDLLLQRKFTFKQKIFTGMLGLLILTGLFRTLSRGSWLGALTGIVVICVMRKRIGLLFLWALAVVPVAALVWLSIPENLRHYALDFDFNSYNIKARLVSAQFAYNAFKQSPWLGVGVGLRKDFDATNVIVTTLAEGGVLGLVAFLTIHACLFRIAWVARKFYDVASANFALVSVGLAFVANRFAHGLVDHYWTRGASLIAWGGAGMVLSAYYNRHRPSSKKR